MRPFSIIAAAPMCYFRRVTRPLFDTPHSLIGAVHVAALPGTPGGSLEVAAIVERAVADARAYADAGLDAVVVENMHDRPYLRATAGPEIVAAMTMVAAAVRGAVGVPVGVQVLAAGDRQAIAVAHAAGAAFVRVECFAFAHVGDEGIHQSNAGDLLRYRKAIGADAVRVLADVKKKHSAHAITADLDIAEAAHAAEFFLADGVIVTGIASGRPALPEDVASVKKAAHVPVLVGSGITAENLGRYAAADAFIVGTSLKRDGDWTQPVDPARARGLVAARDALAPSRRG
jgi:membrane complex biogenesis BtpA family protein